MTESNLAAKCSSYGFTLLDDTATKSRTSSMLLQGWTMTNSLCPLSDFPLFLNKKTGKMWSVRLDCAVKPMPDGHYALTPPAPVDVSTQKDGKSLAKEDVVSKRIGEKLLQGWELMQETCPVTRACPLMKDPESGGLWSPALGEFVGGESNEAESESKSGRFDSDEVSARLGQKLLAGWTMTEESCPVTQAGPLMKDPKSGRLWSPGLNGYLDEQETSKKAKVDVAAHKESEEVVVELGSESKKAESESTSSRFDSDEVSARLGQKLLAGWTMMEESCPVTQAGPLMKDPKSGRLWSPGLNGYLDEHESFRKVKVDVMAPIESVRVLSAAASPAPAVKRALPSNSSSSSSEKIKRKIESWAMQLEETDDFVKSRTLLDLIRDALDVAKELERNGM